MLSSLTKKSYMKRYFLTGMALCLGFISFAQKAVDFKLNPEIGKPLKINMLMKTDVEGPQSVIMDMNMGMEMVASQKDGENFTIENTTKTIKVDIDAGMMTMSYNSEEEAADEMAKALGEQFSKIIDQKITIVMTEKGKTLDVNLPESFAGQGFDKSSFANISASLPENAVSPGESWSSSYEMTDNPLIAFVEQTSTYREESAEGYVIDVEGKMKDGSDNEIGSVKGHYILDKTTHFTKNAVLTTSIEVQGTKVVSDITMSVD